MTEVQRGQIDEVEDDDQFSPAEQGPHKQHDKGEVQQVIENEVTSDSTGGVDTLDVAREEMCDVAAL